jgi:O-antigen/teichoic acid export membrane protein
MLKYFIKTSLVSYIVLGFTMLSSIIVARHYGPTGQGIIVALLLIPQMVINYGDLGVSESIMYHLSNNKGSIKSIKKTLLKIFASLLLIMMLGFGIYLIFFPYSDIEYSYHLGFLYIILLFSYQVLTFIFRGYLKLNIYNLSSLILNLSILSLVVICVILDFPIIYVFISYIVSTVVSIIYLLSKLKFNPVEKGKDEFETKDIYSYGIKTYAYKISASTESQFDKFMIAIFLPSEQLGFYSIAVVFSSLSYLFIVQPIASIILPILNKIEVISEKQKIITLINKLIFWTGIFFGVFLIVFSELIIQLVYGTAYLPALIPLWILLTGVILKAPMSILGYYFKSIGKPEVLIKISTISMVLNVLAGIIFIPKYGIVAAALISTMSYTIYSLLLSRKYMQATHQGYIDQYVFNKQEIRLIFEKFKTIRGRL